MNETAAAASVTPETAARYEAGMKKTTRETFELIKIAIAYGYNSYNINEIFLYGAAFHDLFHTADTYCLCSKEGLVYAPNPFFDSNGKFIFSHTRIC